MTKVNKPAMEEEIEIDAFLKLLTDALRAGPGSAEWHQAVAEVNAGSIDRRDEYALLVKARQTLADGKEYRQVKAGAGFTRKVFAKIDADVAATARSPISASIIAYVGAGLIVATLVLLFTWLIQAGGTVGEDLTNLFFSSTRLAASLEEPLPSGWREIGPMKIDPAKGLMPARSGSSIDYMGGGIVSADGLSAAVPFAVEANFQFQHVSDEVVPQLFVTDDPDFNSDRGTSSHELVWLVRGGFAQVALPDGKLANASKKVVDGQSISIRIVVGTTNASITCDGAAMWSGPSQLANKPRFVGVRLLCRKDEKRSRVIIKQLRVLGK